MVSEGGVVSLGRKPATWPLRVLDGALIVFAHFLTSFGGRDVSLLDMHLALASGFAVLVFNVAADASGLYRTTVRTGARKVEIGRAWVAWLFVPPVLLLVAFSTATTEMYSRLVTLSWFMLAPIFLSFARVFSRKLRGALSRRGISARTVHIVGATRMGATLAERINEDDATGMKVVGYYDDRESERQHPMPDGLTQAVGDLDVLVEQARAGQVDVVYITLPLRAESRISEIVRQLADTTASVYVVADFMVFDLLHAQWSNVQGIPVVSIFESPFYGVNGWLKRLEDIVLGSLILAMIALPMLVIAVLVKLTSAGPVFFRQRRYGLNGEEIRVLKFRSMSVSEDGDQVKQATKNDARITRVGAVLRRTSLDELPQFLNVLSGEMSIVGPRPHAVVHNEQYRRLIHGYMLRHKVKPGITGWAQVNGWRGETDTLEKMEQRVYHDLHYIQNWGLLLDVKIILKTVFGSGTRQNAY